MRSDFGASARIWLHQLLIALPPLAARESEVHKKSPVRLLAPGFLLDSVTGVTRLPRQPQTAGLSPPFSVVACTSDGSMKSDCSSSEIAWARSRSAASRALRARW